MDKKWLKHQLEELGRGAQAALAEFLGYSASVTNKLINTPRRITADEADKIREFIAQYPRGLPGGLPMALPERPRQPSGMREPPPATEIAAPSNIPVWASASAGDETGTIVLVDSPVDYISRSDDMIKVTDPFAFYIVGDSMEDRFIQGDMAVINPSLPLRPDDDCVFIHTAEDGVMYALVKRLLRVTADVWRVRQLNPRRDFDLSRKKWEKGYRIAETRHKG